MSIAGVHRIFIKQPNIKSLDCYIGFLYRFLYEDCVYAKFSTAPCEKIRSTAPWCKYYMICIFKPYVALLQVVHLRQRLDNAVSSSRDLALTLDAALAMIQILIDCDDFQDIATVQVMFHVASTNNYDNYYKCFKIWCS